VNSVYSVLGTFNFTETRPFKTVVCTLAGLVLLITGAWAKPTEDIKKTAKMPETNNLAKFSVEFTICMRSSF